MKHIVARVLAATWVTLLLGCQPGGFFGPAKESVGVSVETSGQTIGPLAGGTEIELLVTLHPVNNCFVVCDGFGPDRVQIGGVDAQWHVIPTSVVYPETTFAIAATTPTGAAAGPADIVVTASNNANVWGSGACHACFRYAPQMLVDNARPDSGSSAGGTPITIALANLGADSVSVLFDSVRVGGARLTDLRRVGVAALTGTTTAGAAGVADVVVYSATNGVATCTACFTYVNDSTASSGGSARH